MNHFIFEKLLGTLAVFPSHCPWAIAYVRLECEQVGLCTLTQFFNVLNARSLEQGDLLEPVTFRSISCLLICLFSNHFIKQRQDWDTAHMCSANARAAAYISELVILCFDLLLELRNAEFRRTVSFVKQCFFHKFFHKFCLNQRTLHCVHF